jgi:phosphopantothenoylcysteine decarboxylase / phosphopantothenate---cysteine ligase
MVRRDQTVLAGKTIVVGICGGIAAYKAVEAVRRLVLAGATVYVIMTENATKFVTPLTFRTISGNPVATGIFDDPEKWDIKHISLSEKADLILVVPATANIIGKIASGIADDLLSSTIAAAHSPVLFAPAMNSRMYENPIVQANIAKLRGVGDHFIEPATGLLACGATGKGRLPDIDEIIKAVDSLIPEKHENSPINTDSAKARDMDGLKVLITAGPTIEPIDPVRFISNRSSGKMGYAVASAASSRGASVMLISGPVNLKPPSGVEVSSVRTAQEMYEKVFEKYKDSDIIILLAAVSDYRCETVSGEKIKKSGANIDLKLEENPDIAAGIGKVKGKRILAGACAETGNLIQNARKKLAAKNFDIIMANDITLEDSGFESDSNTAVFLDRNGMITELPKMQKTELAQIILDKVLAIMKSNT